MTVATLAEAALGQEKRRVKAPPWQRPKDWPALPVVNVGDQKFVGLHAVYDHDSNFCAVNVSGAYTVDWGDGTAPQNVAGGTSAFHTYDYASLASAVTSEGFKTAIVTITPQGAGTLTTVNLAVKHSQAGLISNYATGWLDVRVAGATLSTLVVGLGSNNVNPRNLRQFEFVGPHNMNAAGGAAFFSGCTALESVIVPRSFTSALTTLAGFFQTCAALRSVPPLDTAACTNFSGMFNGCSSLRDFPVLTTSAGTNFGQMFQGCIAMEVAPSWLDTSSGTAFNSMFQGCSLLKSVPLYDTHAGTNFASMFSGCGTLRTVPQFDTSAATTLSQMFLSCTALVAVPSLSTSVCNNFGSMFSGCAALQSVGTMDLSAASSTANVGTMFTGCASLSKLGMTGARFGFTIVGKLSAAELNRVYTNLGIASGAQTLTVTGNYGTSGDDTSIAIAKGWTVVPA